MKIFSSEQIRNIDAYTIAHEPIASIDLMERASEALYGWIAQNLSITSRYIFICGPGNNGGDGLAVARMMFFAGFNVEVYSLNSKSYTPDFSINIVRLKKTKLNLKIIQDESDFPSINKNDIIIDALYGSGLSRPIDGVGARLVRRINESGAVVVSVDIPSGLFSNDNPYPNPYPVVKASICLTLQFPKLSFFFAENEQYIRSWHSLPIGLHPKAMEENETPYFYTEGVDLKSILKYRTIFSHKGTYGHCLVIAGSYGMIGAAALCANSAVKSGAGLVTMHIPQCGYGIAQQLVPTAVCRIDADDRCITSISDIEKYSSICVGPGLGANPLTVDALANLIRNVTVPLLLDADALNIISVNKECLSGLPPNTIITPHPGEFDRLFGRSNSGFERLNKAIDAAKKYKLIVVLKGAYTQIVNSDGCVHFNSTGNPGMATGGSGDVLAGVIGGLLAQGYAPVDAAILGVYIHGFAGDIAKISYGENSQTAQNIIESLSLAFKYLEK